MTMFVAIFANAQFATVEFTSNKKTKQTRTFELKRVSKNTLRLVVPKSNMPIEIEKVRVCFVFLFDVNSTVAN